MEHTKLNFINRSNYDNHNNIVIYQPNEASMSHDEIPIAWKVIKKCGINESHSFLFNTVLEVAIGDSYGNYKHPLEATPGKISEIGYGRLGVELQLSNKITYNPNEFGVLNSLRDGSYSVNCFRNARLLATIDYLYPREEVLFRFSDIISISVLSEAEEGKEIDTSLLGDMETQFDLTGVGSADIIMTGGGEGENAEPFQFSMENIKRKVFKRQESFGPPSWWDGPSDNDQKSSDVPSWWNESESESKSQDSSFGPPSWWKE
jgi:hypothetical protein